MQVRWRIAKYLFAGKHAAVMAAQRAVLVCLITLFAVSAVAGDDAAQAVQEGNVKQWMEYYERERRQNNARDTSEGAAREQRGAPVKDETQPRDEWSSGASTSRPDE